MPRRLAASFWVRPKVRRRRRSAERMQAWESSGSRIAFSSKLALDTPAPVAAPRRAAFDRSPNLTASFKELGVIYTITQIVMHVKIRSYNNMNDAALTDYSGKLDDILSLARLLVNRRY